MTLGTEVLTTSRPARILAVSLLGLGLAVAAAALWRTDRAYVLELCAPVAPNAVYFSAWEDGPVVLDHQPSDGKTVVFHRDYTWPDGCSWRAEETLTPIGRNRYHYRYDEEMLSCPPGVYPTGQATPRSGIVTVRPAHGRPALTPHDGVAQGVGWERAFPVRSRCFYRAR